MMINDFEVARLERLTVVDFLNGEIQSPGAIGAQFEDDAARGAQCTAAALVLMIGLSERLPATLFMTGSSWHSPDARPPPFPACGASGADGCAALHRPAQAPCALPHAHAATLAAWRRLLEPFQKRATPAGHGGRRSVCAS